MTRDPVKIAAERYPLPEWATVVAKLSSSETTTRVTEQRDAFLAGYREGLAAGADRAAIIGECIKAVENGKWGHAVEYLRALAAPADACLFASCTSTRSEDGGSCGRQIPCDGKLMIDGTFTGGCGEPCSFIMDNADELQKADTLADMRRQRDEAQEQCKDFDGLLATYQAAEAQLTEARAEIERLRNLLQLCRTYIPETVPRAMIDAALPKAPQS